MTQPAKKKKPKPASPISDDKTKLVQSSSAPRVELPIGHFEFYLIVTPGFEPVALNELKTWCPNANVVREKGGLTLILPLDQGLALNRQLKTVTRILVRLAKFGCRDFPKLFKKISGFPWEDWVSDESSLEFQASSHASRLFVKKRIEATCLDGRASYLKKKESAAPTQTDGEPINVFVRLQDDVCTLSLDTSGELLHKRGVRTLASDAPLRETTAASVILALAAAVRERNDAIDGAIDGETLPATKQIEIVDPMTGGGTFLIEGAGLFEQITTRGFAFERFTSSRIQPSVETVGPVQSFEFTSFIGYELDLKVAASARENLAGRGDRPSPARPKIAIFAEDFLEAPALERGPARWVVANPPYGERLRIMGRLSEYYENLFSACERVVHPEAAAFILPEKVGVARLRLPPAWSLKEQIRFANGGLPVVVAIYLRKPRGVVPTPAAASV